MSKEKYIPGPWTVGMKGIYGTLNPSVIYADDSGEVVCQVYEIPLHTSLEDIEYSGTWDRRLATARLIAAAPDLLNALEVVSVKLEAIARKLDGTAFSAIDGNFVRQTKMDIDVIINKAGGRT